MIEHYSNQLIANMIIKIKTLVKESNSQKKNSKGKYFLHILVSIINKRLGTRKK